MFQYFLKVRHNIFILGSVTSTDALVQLQVVSTKFGFLDGRELNTHQYSVTSYERDLSAGNHNPKDEGGHQTSHGYAGVPGTRFQLSAVVRGSALMSPNATTQVSFSTTRFRHSWSSTENRASPLPTFSRQHVRLLAVSSPLQVCSTGLSTRVGTD